VTFDPETRTLTLENATIEAFNNDGIYTNIMYSDSDIGVGDDITLVLKGQNKITVSQDNLKNVMPCRRSAPLTSKAPVR
jgi:hypothetical protein